MKFWLAAWRLVLELTIILIALQITVAVGVPDEAVGRVVSVISGDSLGIEMQIADPRTNSIDSIKLADIESPSTTTPEGKEAKKFAYSLLKNKTVFLDIDDNVSGGRNEWSQLMCVIYLMDSEFRPVWPPVNRILVDAGQAKINDDKNNEFDPSTWWQEPAIPQGTKRNLLMEKLSQAQQPAIDASSAGVMLTEDATKSSVLQKDSRSGRVSIGYRT